MNGLNQNIDYHAFITYE